MTFAALFLALLLSAGCCSARSATAEESAAAVDLGPTVKLLQEQMAALLKHRQEDYDALELSLRESVGKNTELAVLKNELKLLRKEMSTARGTTNESKKLRWLAGAVAELRAELAEVLRTRSLASEELAEREKLRSEMELLRADVAGLDRGVRDLGARITRLESALDELKPTTAGSQQTDHLDNEVSQEKTHPSRHVFSRLPSTLRRLEDRLSKLERKVTQVGRKRAFLEKRIVYEDDREHVARRLRVLESLSRDHTEKIRNVTKELEEFGEATLQMFEATAANQSETTRQLARLDVDAARKTADLTATREELSNLKRAVQALSVSASKLQEKQQTLDASVAKAANATKELEHVEDEYRKMVDSLPGNCQEKDGLTLLAPGPGAPLLAACRKGWIVVGRRVDGTVNFDRTWNDYAQGFGSPINEFWAGNEALHRLSRDNCTRLRIELNDIDGNYWVANYEDFSIGSEETGYRLRVGGYSGNATDAMSYQNNMAFSAKDRDMDISSTDCAANYHGGWWFSHCQHANLNGRYSLGLTWYRSDSNQWMAVAATELSVQRKQQCL